MRHIEGFMMPWESSFSHRAHMDNNTGSSEYELKVDRARNVTVDEGWEVVPPTGEGNCAILVGIFPAERTTQRF